MTSVPDDLRYTQDHEWLRLENGVATIGITDYAQGELGDVVFLELPEVGRAAAVGDAIGTIEAVKTVADLYAPLAGAVVAINATLDERPELVNEDPYGEGWMIKLELESPDAAIGLLDAAAYRAHIG